MFESRAPASDFCASIGGSQVPLDNSDPPVCHARRLTPPRAVPTVHKLSRDSQCGGTARSFGNPPTITRLKECHTELGAARFAVTSASKRFLREPAGSHSQADGTRVRAPPAIPPEETVSASTPSVLPRSQEGAMTNPVAPEDRHA